MRIPAISDLIIYRNTDFINQFTVESNGIPLNISTYTFTSKIRDKDGNFIADFTITKPDNFSLKMQLAKATTESLELETYYYDMIQSVSGVEELILKGIITVENTITNLE